MRDDFFEINEISKLRRDWDADQTMDYLRQLPVWTGAVKIAQKFGGLQNRTFFVTDGDRRRYAVRCGFDQYRTRQTSVVHCTIGAWKLGLGPRLRYAEPNVVITDFVDGPKMQSDQLKEPSTLAHVIQQVKRLHQGSHAVEESISYWWPFHTVRRYLNEMEKGKAATGFSPSEWVEEVPRLRDITDRLERAIGPYIPMFTHNDLGYANMIFNDRNEVWFIDWDGGGFGHPMWDLAEMLMWLESDEEMDRFAFKCYFGSLDESRIKGLLHEHRAFKIMAALRLVVEVMVTMLDPYFYLTPEEMSRGMAVFFPGQKARLHGLIDLLRPNFDLNWQQFGSDYA
jgi:thiamine kinase-like enzyme